MDEVTGEALFQLYRNMSNDQVVEMRGLVFVLMSYLVMYVTADERAKNNTNIVDLIGQGIQKEIQTVKQPIDETLSYVGSSQCQHVKKLIGVSYEQLEGENEPDLSKLSLVYKTREGRRIINIASAPQTFREARKLGAGNKINIYVHGFTDDPTKSSFSNISEPILNNSDTSIIALDGSSLIRWLYLRSSTYVQFIGRTLGETLAELVHQGQDPTNIHIIGHSLGAHISGFAGKTFQNLTGTKVGRISGLDPAGPCFSHVEENNRLKYSDAEFVDVIHSDGGVYGLKEPVGHADYYPNSGALQPGCLLQTCSHSRAWLLYAESIRTPDSFPARRCADWDHFKTGNCDENLSLMGYGSTPKTRGNYYLQTNRESPFARGRDGLVYENTDGVVQNITNALGSTSSNVLKAGTGVQEAIIPIKVPSLLKRLKL